MAEGAAPKPAPAPTPEELQRGINHLREDIRDLRNQIGGTHHRIDETNRSLGAQIQTLHRRLDAHFMWTMTTLVAITGILIAVIKL